MTDKELIEHVFFELANGRIPSKIYLEPVEDLAIKGVERAPDPDAAEVKLAVCFDQGNNDLRAYGCGDYENPKEALLEMRALHQLTPTHEGIVTARLPRVRVLEVEGKVQ
jgi:hypothetical protein